MTSSTTHTPVLIVGGGVVGLSAALFLAAHSTPCIVVERRPGASAHPRALGLDARTMELFRRLSIDGAVRDAGGASIAPAVGIREGTSPREVVGSKPRTRREEEEEADGKFAGLAASLGPANGAYVTQEPLESVLAERAERTSSVDVRFGTECGTVEQDEHGVTATVKDRRSGVVSRVRAAFLIAADGAGSPIRTRLGIPTTGRGRLGSLVEILFEADLGEFVRRRGPEFPALLVVARPGVRGLLAPVDYARRWVFHVAYDPASGEQAADFSRERCAELLRLALGTPDAKVSVKSIRPWEPAVCVAERMQVGRVFLAGDAAHEMPPWGGQGVSVGVADVHNLAWKLAAVLGGRAGMGLLETYDVERLPVGRCAAEAAANGTDKTGLIRTKLSLGAMTGFARKIPLSSGHGYSYSSRAICEENTFPLGGITWKSWSLASLFCGIDGRPGRRVPHIWVVVKGKRISTLDLCDNRFVLLTGSGGDFWKSAAEDVSSALRITIDTFCAGPAGDAVSPAGTFETAVGVSSRGAILVRPDDFVVWRQRQRPAASRAALEEAMRKALVLQYHGSGDCCRLRTNKKS